jgi:hypothetical protein
MRVAWGNPAGTHAKAIQQRTRVAVVVTGVSAVILAATGIAFAATAAGKETPAPEGKETPAPDGTAIPHTVAVPKIVPGTAGVTPEKNAGKARANPRTRQ